MSLMTAITSYDHKSRGVGAIFSAISKDLSSKIRYSQYGFQDFSPDAEDEQLTKWAGPGKGILTGEGVTYGDEQLWRDYPKSPVMRKYTLRLQVTEEQLYWLNKAGTQKQVNQITNMFEGIINGLNYNIDYDAERFWYLGFGTTFYSGGRLIIAAFKSLLNNWKLPIGTIRGKLSQIKNGLLQPQRLTEGTMQFA